MDALERIVARMIADPEVKWWHDDDTGRWHAQHTPTGLSRVSTYGRDAALTWLSRDLHDHRAMSRYQAAITSTCA